jgi:NAD(P)-dependent dehydrogenase (short-subunit alcohol dehydrogenase family)
MRPDRTLDRDQSGDEVRRARRTLSHHQPGPAWGELPAESSGQGRDAGGVDPEDEEVRQTTGGSGEDEDESEGDIDDDALPDAIEEEPRTVLITGACGNIGRKLRAAWADAYDLVLIDAVSSPDDPEVIAADLTLLDDDWITHFHGVDTVVHLAANSNELALWEELIGPNLDALANVFHAAALAGVERIVFASSSHVMGDYQTLREGPITVEMKPMPDGPYGVTKLVGERLGRSLARAFDLTFIAIRLGWIQEGKNRPETLPHDWARQMWLSNADLIQLFDCAVEAEIEDRSFVLVNGMSRNHGMRWDLSGAAELLGFLPKDDAFAEVRA